MVNSDREDTMSSLGEQAAGSHKKVQLLHAKSFGVLLRSFFVLLWIILRFMFLGNEHIVPQPFDKLFYGAKWHAKSCKCVYMTRKKLQMRINDTQKAANAYKW